MVTKQIFEIAVVVLLLAPGSWPLEQQTGGHDERGLVAPQAGRTNNHDPLLRGGYHIETTAWIGKNADINNAAMVDGANGLQDDDNDSKQQQKQNVFGRHARKRTMSKKNMKSGERGKGKKGPAQNKNGGIMKGGKNGKMKGEKKDKKEKNNNVVRAIEGGTVSAEGIGNLTFPGEFFQEDATIRVARVVQDPSIQELFDDTALVFNVRNRLPYEITIAVDKLPPTRDDAHMSVVLPDTFVETVSPYDQVEVLVRIGQSSETGEDFSVFELGPSSYDERTKVVVFWLPSFALEWAEEGLYTAVVSIVATPGRDGVDPVSSARRRMKSTEHRKRQVTESEEVCKASSIRCPLRNGCDSVTSPFDMKRIHPIRNVIRPHYGVDFAVSIGDEVIAASDGVIEASRFMNGYGETLVLRHDDGSATLYAHLSQRLKPVGDRVVAEETIGLGGNTPPDLVTGPNLHFEYVPSGQLFRSKNRINPYPCIDTFSQDGSVTVGDSGSVADDSFKLFVDDRPIGTTAIGEIKNLSVNGLRRGSHKLTIEIVIAPDGIGSYYVQLNNGLKFSDGTTSKGFDQDADQDLTQGQTRTWEFVVGDEEEPRPPETCTSRLGTYEGKCIESPECKGDGRAFLFSSFLTGLYCSGSSNNNDIGCCFKTPQCLAHGGECKHTSQCDSGFTSIDNLCPGGSNIKCCVPDTACADAVNGACKAPNSCNGLVSDSFCPTTGEVCCIEESVPCTGEGFSGECTSSSDCDSSEKVVVPDGQCVGNDNVCCSDGPSCSFLGIEAGTCRSSSSGCECDELELFFMSCPSGSTCCVEQPEGSYCPAEALSPEESYKFNSLLQADTTSLARHVVEVSAWCQRDSNGGAFPHVGPPRLSIPFQDPDESFSTKIAVPVRTRISKDTVRLDWFGLAYEGEDSLLSLGVASDSLAVVSGSMATLGNDNYLWDDFYKISKDSLDDVKVGTIVEGNFNAPSKFTKAMGMVGNGLTIATFTKDVLSFSMDLEGYWLYHRAVQFTCDVVGPPRPSYKLRVEELTTAAEKGPNNIQLTAMDEITGQSSGFFTTLSTTHSASPKVEHRAPVLSDSSGFVTYDIYSQICRRNVWGNRYKLLETVSMTASFRCNPNDGFIESGGWFGPSLDGGDGIPLFAIKRINDRTIQVHLGGSFTDGDHEDLAYYSSFSSTVGVASMVVGAVATPATGTVVYLAGNGVLLLADLVADIVDANYKWSSERRIHFVCESTGAGWELKDREDGNSLDYSVENFTAVDGRDYTRSYCIEPHSRRDPCFVRYGPSSTRPTMTIIAAP